MLINKTINRLFVKYINILKLLKLLNFVKYFSILHKVDIVGIIFNILLSTFFYIAKH
jgi:hypothetical protein